MAIGRYYAGRRLLWPQDAAAHIYYKTLKTFLKLEISEKNIFLIRWFFNFKLFFVDCQKSETIVSVTEYF